MNKMILIEAPSNLGLKEPSPGVEPGVKLFPLAMAKAGFAEIAGIKEQVGVKPPVYSTEIDEESKVRNADKIIDYSKQLSKVVDEKIQNKRLPVIIGGDCSILI